MISDLYPQVPDYSSSDLTVLSVRNEAVLELGRKLTKELDMDDSVDTLGRWMAHYIAGLIRDVEEASAEEKHKKMQFCSDAILKLWKHRSVFNHDSRPFKDIDPILRALESLDPESATPRYFPAIEVFHQDADESEETKSLLKLIDGIDLTARILIRYCLTQAAQNALDKSKEWVKLAQAADADEGVEFSVFEIAFKESRMVNDPNQEERNLLKNRIKQLEKFARMAKEVALTLHNHGQVPDVGAIPEEVQS